MKSKSQKSITLSPRLVENKINEILEAFNSDDRLVPLDVECLEDIHTSHAPNMTFPRFGRALLNIINELQQRCELSVEGEMVSPWETESVALSRMSIWAQTVWANLTAALEAINQSDMNKSRREILLSANSLGAFAAYMDILEKAQNEMKSSFLEPKDRIGGEP